MTAALSIDPVLMCKTWLEADLGTSNVSSRLPANLASVLPWLQLQRVGGPDDGYALDMPTMNFQCYAADEPSSSAFAYQVAASVRRMKGQTVNGGAVTYLRKLSGPFWVDYENPAVSRHILTYELRITAA